MKEGYALGRLQFTGSAEEAVKNSDIIFIAVGTPPKYGQILGAQMSSII